MRVSRVDKPAFRSNLGNLRSKTSMTQTHACLPAETARKPDQHSLVASSGTRFSRLSLYANLQKCQNCDNHKHRQMFPISISCKHPSSQSLFLSSSSFMPHLPTPRLIRAWWTLLAGLREAPHPLELAATPGWLEGCVPVVSCISTLPLYGQGSELGRRPFLPGP